MRIGLCDFYRKDEAGHKTEKMIFAVIGAISKIKGQHVFLDAIEKLSSHSLKRCEFWLVGKPQPPFGEQVVQCAMQMDGVFLLDETSMDTLHEQIYPAIS